MSGDRLRGRCRAFAAIFLCIGIASIPCLMSSVVNASIQRNFVKVTTELCGVKGVSPHTVSLTKSQYEKLTYYLDDLMERLNATTSQDETIILFHKAVAKLNNYGLLPSGMSVHQAQVLVSGSHQHSKTFSQIENKLFNRWNKKQGVNAYPVLQNALCTLFATATKIPEYPNPVIIPLGVLLALGLFPALIVSVFGQEELASRLAELGLALWMSNPLRWSNYVVFEGYDIEFQSLGLKGLVQGTLNTSGIFRGFTGLMLSPSSDTMLFLGFAVGIYASG